MQLFKVLWMVYCIHMMRPRSCDGNTSQYETEIVFSMAESLKIAVCIFAADIENGENKLSDVTLSKAYKSNNKLLVATLSLYEISRFVREGSRSSTVFARTMVVTKMTNDTLCFLQELSHVEKLSVITWIMFSDSHLDVNMFQYLYVPFDCQFIYVHKQIGYFSIIEIYHVMEESKLESYVLGNWTESKGLNIVDMPLYARRNTLKGLTFRGVIKNNPPYSMVETDGNVTTFQGYLSEIWCELERRINFRTEFTVKNSEEDLKKALKNNEVDFAVARIPSGPHALEYMDVSEPIGEARYYAFSHRHGAELDWNSYLKPFSTNTWLVNLIWMLSSSLALAILYKVAWNFGTSEREADYFAFTLSESALTVFRAICMQGSEITPRSYSCRLFFLSIYFTALVVTSAFSAALFSLLTVPKTPTAFNSIEAILSNRRYKIYLPSNLRFRKAFEDYSNTLAPPVRNTLKERLSGTDENHNLSPEQGLKHLCDDRFYVFLYDLPNVLYLMGNSTRSCHDEILPSNHPLFVEYISFGFRKNNPYRKLININLTRLKSEGILHRLILIYWPPQIQSVQASWVRVTLSDISPILYMFAAGVVAGVLTLYVEKIIKKKVKKS